MAVDMIKGEIAIYATSPNRAPSFTVSTSGLSLGGSLSTIATWYGAGLFSKTILVNPFFSAAKPTLDFTVQSCQATSNPPACIKYFIGNMIGLDASVAAGTTLTSSNGPVGFGSILNYFHLKAISGAIILALTDLSENGGASLSFTCSAYSWGSVCISNTARPGYCSFQIRHLMAVNAVGMYPVSRANKIKNANIALIGTVRDGFMREGVIYASANTMKSAGNAVSYCLYYGAPGCGADIVSTNSNTCGVPHSLFSRTEGFFQPPMSFIGNLIFVTGAKTTIGTSGSSGIATCSSISLNNQPAYADNIAAMSQIVTDANVRWPNYFATGLATKVQTSVANAAKDFESQRKEMIEKKKEMGDVEEDDALKIKLPPISPIVIDKENKMVANVLGLFGGAKAAESDRNAATVSSTGSDSASESTPAASAAAAPTATSGDENDSTTTSKPKEEGESVAASPAVATPSTPLSPLTPAIFTEAAMGMMNAVRKKASLFALSVPTSVATEKSSSNTVAQLPWHGLSSSASSELKKQVLALSSEKRNFLVDPPAGTDYVFDMKDHLPTAMALLKIDPALDRMRFELVPKQIKEPIFWKNYFYRVSLLKQSISLLEDSTPIPADSTDITSPTPSTPLPVPTTSTTGAPNSSTSPAISDILSVSPITQTTNTNDAGASSSSSGVLVTDSSLPTAASLMSSGDELDDALEGEEFNEAYGSDWEKELQEELKDV
ncbi:Synapse-associated protein 1 [Blyttiomyces sp. JEL0837]|nr:Synapse-associated protein 1 [Blyttiomyces sp. JEL0837]